MFNIDFAQIQPPKESLRGETLPENMEILGAFDIPFTTDEASDFEVTQNKNLSILTKMKISRFWSTANLSNFEHFDREFLRFLFREKGNIIFPFPSSFTL